MKIQPLGRGMIGFTTTNDCTARCAHCLMCCEPGAKQYLNAKQMISAIEQARKMADVHVAVFTGGEPMLLGKELLKAIKYCYDHKIIARVVTNAFWADTPEHAEKVIHVLRTSGLLELNISIDDYHAEYIPEQNIVNVWNAVQGKKFSSVIFANCTGANSRITPEYIQKLIGQELKVIDTDDRYFNPEYAANLPKIDGTEYAIVTNGLQRTGRAEEEILGDENFVSPLTQEQLHVMRCGNIIQDATIGYNNHVVACCGINTEGNSVLDLGDLSKEPLADILNRAADSVIINAIAQAGPYALRGYVLLQDDTVPFKEKYTSICEVCKDVTENPRAMEIIRKNLGEVFVMTRKYKKIVDDAYEEAKRMAAEKEQEK